MSAAEDTHRALLRLGDTVAVAESLTGGLLSAALTALPGASATFRGGLVTYATDLKASLAGVPDHVLSEHGPVHEEVAVALARGARAVCRADWGLGVTGVAGPEPQGSQPVGTVWVAAAHEERGISRLGRFSGDRTEVRAAAVQLALDLLLDQLRAAEAAR